MKFDKFHPKYYFTLDGVTYYVMYGKTTEALYAFVCAVNDKGEYVGNITQNIIRETGTHAYFTTRRKRIRVASCSKL